MKIRNILFGYCYENGKIVVKQSESEIVKELVQQYLLGKSLLYLSKWLNEQRVEYMPNVVGWNKSRIMRLLEDKRYLGNEKYPALIEKSAHEMIKQIKDSKNDTKHVDRTAEIFQLTLPVRCAKCNSIMRRKVDGRLKNPARWRCKCGMSVGKSDESLLKEIAQLLNGLITNPELITIPIEKVRETNLETRRLNNEITRMFDTQAIDRETVRKKMIEYASLLYSDIDVEPSIAQRLKDYFMNITTLDSFSSKILENVADEIRLYSDGTISIVLENKQEIRNGGL